MALATQCPHCHTTFRVAADQLKLRGGIVRCGACQRIFDGNAHLIDLDKPAAPQDTHDADADALPVYTLDFDHTFDALGILPKTVTPDEAQPAPEPEPAVPAPRAQVWRSEEPNNVFDGLLVPKPFIAGDRQGRANLELAFEPELNQRPAHDRGEAGR